MKLWLNGTIMETQQAVIPVSDHGFLYGMGLFETLRTYAGQPFLLERHMQRLHEGCEELRIANAPDAAEVRSIVRDLLEANKEELRGGDAYLRLSVSAGEAPLGLPSAEGYRQPNVVLMMKKLPSSPYPPKPKSAALLRTRRNSPEGAVRRKSFHYMNNIVGKWELAGREVPPDTEGLFLNESGFVVEGIVSNVFLVRGGTLATPAVSNGLLPGITRQFVCELAAKHGFGVEEGHYRWEDVVAADELFITNSVQEIVPVHQLIGEADRSVHTWEAGAGRVTAALAERYRIAVQEAVARRGEHGGGS